jgi:hypothetical protein
VFEVSGDVLGTLGIFLSGAGSILTAIGAIHYERKRGLKDCDKRMEALWQGMHMREELEEKK